MYSKLIVDISNFYMRAYSVGSSMTHKMEDETELVTGGIYNFLRMMKAVENRFLEQGGETYFLFDNCHSGDNRRKLIDPDYKANRTKKDENFYRSMDILQTIILNYKDTWFCVKKQGYEADDLVYPLVQEFAGEQILLVSNDLDWFRAISPTVHVAKYEKSEGDFKPDYVIYTPERFEERMGFKASTNAMVVYKAFRGDGSDNIPAGVSGIRSEALNEIVSKCSSISEVIDKLNSFEKVSATYKAKILENKNRLLLNEKLVSYQVVDYASLAEDIYKCTFHPKVLHSLYKALGFNVGNIDPRVQQFYARDSQPITNKTFFVRSKIDRA